MSKPLPTLSKPLPASTLPVKTASRPIPTLGLGNNPFAVLDDEVEGDVVEQGEAKLKEAATGFLKRAQDEAKRREQITDSEYWVCLCFETRDQKQELLRKLGLIDLGDKHVDGLQVAERLGVSLESPRLTFPKVRSTKLGDLT